MRTFRFILLIITTLIFVGLAVLLTIDGNLSRLWGKARFNPGERLFPYSREEMNDISWMRINCMGEIVEVKRLPNGIWWCKKPWVDRMDPRAAAAILQFTCSTKVVDSLPLHKIDSASLKEFGVKTAPTTITLKEQKNSDDSDKLSTVARYTLGAVAPWQEDDIENKTTNDTTYMQTDFYGRNTNIIVGTGNILPLFKSGIRKLRDHRPLLIHPSMPARIEIKNKEQHIVLERSTPNSSWKIVHPLLLDTDSEMVNVLIGTLQKLTAVRVLNPEEMQVPNVDENQICSVSINNFTSRENKGTTTLTVEETPVTLRLYPPADATADLVKATVSDRHAVFELKQTGTGSGEEALPGVRNIPLDLNLLRSKQLTDIGDYKIIKLSLRKGFEEDPVIAEFINNEGKPGLTSTWVYSSEGAPFQEANPDQLVSVLKTIKQGKVSGVATDKATDLSIYGLDNPLLTLSLSLLPKPNEDPRPPIIIFFSKGADGSWYARQSDKPSVAMLSEEYMKPFMVNSLSWKKKHLLSFNKFDLKEMQLERFGSDGPLILHFDRLDDTWTAEKDGEDQTLNINPHRANRYLEELEKLEVLAWLPFSDINAHRSLQHPVFRLRLKLETTKDLPEMEKQYQGEDITFTSVPETEQKELILEIAPAGEPGYSRFYYGRINTSPYYFILNMDAVRLLGSSLKEDN